MASTDSAPQTAVNNDKSLALARKLEEEAKKFSTSPRKDEKAKLADENRQVSFALDLGFPRPSRWFSLENSKFWRGRSRETTMSDRKLHCRESWRPLFCHRELEYILSVSYLLARQIAFILPAYASVVQRNVIHLAIGGTDRLSLFLSSWLLLLRRKC